MIIFGGLGLVRGMPLFDSGNPYHSKENGQFISKSDTIDRSSLRFTSLRTDWGDFPDTIIDRKLGDATSHPLYHDAKSGNVRAALAVVTELITDDAVNRLKALIGDKTVMLAPVHAEEASGRNMIPVAIANILAKHLNATVEMSIVQANKVSRTGGDGWHRLANPPVFDGEIPTRSQIIMVDDTQTQGGTFAAFKGHIEQNGGQVIGSYALTGKQYSVQLRPSKDTLVQLRSKYAELETWWQETFGYDFSKLTEWEAKFIINSGQNADTVRDRIIAAKQG